MFGWEITPKRVRRRSKIFPRSARHGGHMNLLNPATQPAASLRRSAPECAGPASPTEVGRKRQGSDLVTAFVTPRERRPDASDAGPHVGRMALCQRRSV